MIRTGPSCIICVDQGQNGGRSTCGARRPGVEPAERENRSPAVLTITHRAVASHGPGLGRAIRSTPFGTFVFPFVKPGQPRADRVFVLPSLVRSCAIRRTRPEEHGNASSSIRWSTEDAARAAPLWEAKKEDADEIRSNCLLAGRTRSGEPHDFFDGRCTLNPPPTRRPPLSKSRL
jgi:hypothetical protein